MKKNNQRFICTKDDSWSPEKGKQAVHPDAKYMGDIDHGLGEYCAQYKCPYCGKYFEVEIAQ